MDKAEIENLAYDIIPAAAIFADCSEHLEDMRARAFQRLEPLLSSAWQPIETAPTDGTRILAVHENGSDIQITWFGKTSHVPLYGWCEGEDAEDIDLWRPTHWQPLPAAPTVGETE